MFSASPVSDPRPCPGPAAGLPAFGGDVWANVSADFGALRAEPLTAMSPHLPRLALHRAGEPGRAAVEAFIAAVYARRFGAQVAAFAPVLVSLSDETGLLAAAGYRPATGGPLFLERYLPAPAEHWLAVAHGAQAERRALVEVGHLAAVRAGEGRRLIGLLAAHLAARGHDWVVCTLTEELRHLFQRLGVDPLSLGRADPAALGAEAAHWGSYYDHRPMVAAGRLGPALQRLQRLQRPGGAAA